MEKELSERRKAPEFIEKEIIIEKIIEKPVEVIKHIIIDKIIEIPIEIIRNIEDIISHIETKEKFYENYAINNQGYLKKEEASWFNRLLETFFERWKENDFFMKWFKKLLYRIYNKKRPQNLDTIWIDDIQVINFSKF